MRRGAAARRPGVLFERSDEPDRCDTNAVVLQDWLTRLVDEFTGSTCPLQTYELS